MRALLKPVLLLLDSLKYAYKFALIGILVLIPLAVTLQYLIVELNEGHEFAYDEQTGTQYNAGLQQVLLSIDEHRKLTLSGNAAATGSTASDSVNRQIAAMDAIDGRLGERLEASEQWKALKADWVALAADKNQSPEQLSQSYSALLTKGIALISHVGDTSKLILDPDLDSYYLMDATLLKLPLLIRQLGELRDQGLSWADKPALNREETTALIEQAAYIRAAANSIEAGYGVIAQQNPSLEPILEQPTQRFLTSLERYLSVVNDSYLAEGGVRADVSAFTAAAEEATASTNALYIADAEQLSRLIDIRQDHYADVRTFIITFVCILSAVVCYFFIGFYYSIREAIRSLLRSASEVAQGRLTTRMHVRTRDEMNMTAGSFNDMVASVQSLIASGKRSAEQVANTSAQLADIASHSTLANDALDVSIKETASGTEAQLQGTEDTARAMSEITQGIERIADTTGIVMQESLNSASQAEDGKLALDRVTEQMGVIVQTVDDTAQAVHQMNEVAASAGEAVALIKAIASKSNILALNASIEAVRAGEHGRGFSVVAGETRKLAEMSDKHANDIAELIERIQAINDRSMQSMSHVQQEVRLGSRSVQEAAHTFELIVSSTNAIARQIEEVSAASEQMSASTEQISATIHQIATIARNSSDQVGHMNAMSSRNSASMQELSTQAASLRELSRTLQSEMDQFSA
ncbi:methyl-accepting chemotaxis protein [Cohnella panacarvi]|uniref:methyl-accepting chemotaxis protein n=1 Tax=Cohnella panacarvi TaxID=400776 RepID=UPI0004792DDB|nr:HAMP domain-containing methyl-accepting chemotaxis protein [Cohnella panacarvi]